MRKNEMTVTVYLDQINYLGEVIDSTVIAKFRNMGWASEFIAKTKLEFKDDKLSNIRVEVK